MRASLIYRGVVVRRQKIVDQDQPDLREGLLIRPVSLQNSRMAAVSGGFNRWMQHIGQIVLPASHSLAS